MICAAGHPPASARARMKSEFTLNSASIIAGVDTRRNGRLVRKAALLRLTLLPFVPMMEYSSCDSENPL